MQTNADLVAQNTEAVTQAAAQVAQDKTAVEEASADVSREIADFNGKLDAGAVSADMVEFLDLERHSENLFDPSQPIASGQVYGESGQLTANANYDSTTEYIYAGHVAGHTVYASDSIRTLLEYDESRQLLVHTAYVNGAVGKQLTANTQYLKISIPAGQAEQFVVRADSPVTEYIPYQNTYTLSDEVDISPSVAKDISEPLGCGMNVLAPDLSWDTGILTDTGASNPSYNAYKSSGYIPVKPSQVYTIYHWDESRQACILSAIRAYCFYGAGKEFISRLVAGLKPALSNPNAGGLLLLAHIGAGRQSPQSIFGRGQLQARRDPRIPGGAKDCPHIFDACSRLCKPAARQDHPGAWRLHHPGRRVRSRVDHAHRKQPGYGGDQ